MHQLKVIKLWSKSHAILNGLRVVFQTWCTSHQTPRIQNKSNSSQRNTSNINLPPVSSVDVCYDIMI